MRAAYGAKKAMIDPAPKYMESTSRESQSYKMNLGAGLGRQKNLCAIELTAWLARSRGAGSIYKIIFASRATNQSFP